MLQRSLSTSWLFEQAEATIRDHQTGEDGQNRDLPSMGQATSASAAFTFSSRRESSGNPTLHHSILSLGPPSSGTGEKKHIHFSEQVEQYIALEINGDDDGELNSSIIDDCEDSDSDDEGIMMKTIHSKRKLPLMSNTGAAQGNFSVNGKTIAMLPSTTLKYGEIIPEPVETAMEHSNGFRNESKFSLSICTQPGRDLENDNAIVNWLSTGAFTNNKESMAVTQDRPQNLYMYGPSLSLGCDQLDRRRTPLDMFMLNERDKDEVAPEGLVEKMLDTVNVAKDIGYMFWNVGWKR
jgi:hypothetical protein